MEVPPLGLKPNEIKRKWAFIKSVTDSTFEDDPAEGIHIDGKHTLKSWVQMEKKMIVYLQISISIKT